MHFALHSGSLRILLWRGRVKIQPFWGRLRAWTHARQIGIFVARRRERACFSFTNFSATLYLFLLPFLLRFFSRALLRRRPNTLAHCGSFHEINTRCLPSVSSAPILAVIPSAPRIAASADSTVTAHDRASLIDCKGSAAKSMPLNFVMAFAASSSLDILPLWTSRSLIWRCI